MLCKCIKIYLRLISFLFSANFTFENIRLKSLVNNSALVIENLSHSYNKKNANSIILNTINLKIKKGELLGLLGPSGCGKTTLLRLIAGFEYPIKGKIFLENQEITNSQKILPPEKRNIGMVFQDYALFPHLNVYQNTVFGLKNRSNKNRVNYLLDVLGIEALKDRYPHELSGGQRQRLAIARALAPGTSFLLLDEPFCSLDLNVRLRIRSELPNILKSFNASGLMVTHDPEEAMAICDKVAVMNKGNIHQIESPSKLIKNPKTLFVSSFILGNNILKIEQDKDFIYSCLGKFKPQNISNKIEYLSISPKYISLVKSKNGNGIVISKEFLGDYYVYKIAIEKNQIRVRTDINNKLDLGQRCVLKVSKNSEYFLYPGGLKNFLK